jgi:hypothetical protein
MKNQRGITCVLTAFALTMPGLLGAADQKSGTSGTQNTDSPKERLVAAGQLLGEITKIAEDGKSFTLRMHQKVPQLNVSSIYGSAGGGGCSH